MNELMRANGDTAEATRAMLRRTRKYPHETYEVIIEKDGGVWTWYASGVEDTRSFEDDLALPGNCSGFTDSKAAQRHAAEVLDDYHDTTGRWAREKA